ncbi:MAG: 6-bladed beta-propeller [Symbiobacteriia bacterium]
MKWLTRFSAVFGRLLSFRRAPSPGVTWNHLFSTIAIIGVLQASLFSYSYIIKRNPTKIITSRIPTVLAAPTPPIFAYNIFGEWGEGTLVKPMAVAVAGQRIYVSDSGNQRVQVFDYDGKPVMKIGKAGEGPGEFRFPYGIAVDGSGQVYVADLYNGDIQVFGPDGHFLRYFGEADPSSDIITGPAGLTLSGDRLYVADVRKCQVLVFSLDGRLQQTIGAKGEKPGQLASPNFVAVNGDRVYVVDTGNDRVEVFATDGKFIEAFDGGTGSGDSLVVNPRGIAFDGRGVLYVVSNLTNHVHGFDRDGKRFFSFGNLGADDGAFYLPNGLAIDDQGRVYVTDTANGRVVVFQI